VLSLRAVQLALAPPAELGGLPLLGARVAWEEDGGTRQVNFTAGVRLELAASLIAQKVTFTTWAVNAAGRGNPTTVSALMRVPPSQPAGVTGTIVSSTEIRVGWAVAPGEQSLDLPLLFAEVDESSDRGRTFARRTRVTDLTLENETTMARVLSHLPASQGLTFWFRVRLANAAGSSAWSPLSSAVALVFPPKPPSALAAEPVARDMLRLSWVPPVDSGGLPVLKYLVCVGGGEGCDVLGGASLTTVEGPEANVSGLLAGELYQVKVAARNAEGTSDYASVAHRLQFSPEPVASSSRCSYLISGAGT
jgi:hypothetical protein